MVAIARFALTAYAPLSASVNVCVCIYSLLAQASSGLVTRLPLVLVKGATEHTGAAVDGSIADLPPTPSRTRETHTHVTLTGTNFAFLNDRAFGSKFCYLSSAWYGCLITPKKDPHETHVHMKSTNLRTKFVFSMDFVRVS